MGSLIYVVTYVVGMIFTSIIIAIGSNDPLLLVSYLVVMFYSRGNLMFISGVYVLYMFLSNGDKIIHTYDNVIMTLSLL